MKKSFEDICITGKPDAAQVKPGSKAYTYVFLFPLSAVPPQRWNELLVQEWDYRIMQTPRHIGINEHELAIDCSGEELGLIVRRVAEDIQIVNRKYRKELDTNRAKTDEEKQQAVEERLVDAASIKRAIDDLILPN